MAFNFNWSPLIADTSRARDMLTTALNKSPKPPIIVDDIIVTELNLGSLPPELEILEIGDLAEDRFRGIFKMQYAGDAYLTLKTRVQVNPLHTYLSAKPLFASPRPLAADSGLTIPLQITLSDIRLSGFVILVFSRQKGITLVFRNDPLESLKVSSTFDSIPFVRDYLQKEIEGQLRVLFMEDLPAIIHRLSLRLWVPEHQQQPVNKDRELGQHEINSNTRSEPSGVQDGFAKDQTDEKPIDPLATPSQVPRDADGRPLQDPDALSLEDSTIAPEAHFSQKNLLRLAALTDSHRTLSLFTPPIRDAVFRAWAGAAERGDPLSHHASGPAGTLRRSGFTLASLHSAQPSLAGGKASSVHSASQSSMDAVSNAASAPAKTFTSYSFDRRPSLQTSATSYGGSTLISSRSGGARRKRKHRVVNLRKDKPPAETDEQASGRDTRADSSQGTHSRPSSPSSAPPASHSWRTSSSSYSYEREGELQTPPQSPEKLATTATPHARVPTNLSLDASGPLPPPATPRALNAAADIEDPGTIRPQRRAKAPARRRSSPHARRALSASPPPLTSPYANAQPGGILEQAWMMKMAAEIARKVESERLRQQREAVGRDDDEGGDGKTGISSPVDSKAFDAGFWGQGPSGSTFGASEREAPPAYAE